MLGVNKICTGHNADDIAETVVMNILRGDVARSNHYVAIFFLRPLLEEDRSKGAHTIVASLFPKVL